MATTKTTTGSQPTRRSFTTGDRCQKKIGHVTGAKPVSGTDFRTYSCFVMTNASAKRIGEPDLYIFDAYLMEHQQIKMKARLRF